MVLACSFPEQLLSSFLAMGFHGPCLLHVASRMFGEARFTQLCLGLSSRHYVAIGPRGRPTPRRRVGGIRSSNKDSGNFRRRSSNSSECLILLLDLQQLVSAWDAGTTTEENTMGRCDPDNRQPAHSRTVAERGPGPRRVACHGECLDSAGDPDGTRAWTEAEAAMEWT